jgi:HD superfamily phosphodiesterase
MRNQFYDLGTKYGFGWNEKHSNQVIKLGHQLYEKVVAVGLLPRLSTGEKQVLQDAGYVHDVGRSPKAVGEGEHNDKSVTTLKKELGSTLCAEGHTQLVLYCVGHHRGEEWKKLAADKEVPADLLGDAKRLCGIFRIADALDYGRQERVNGITLTLEGRKLTCKLFPRDARASTAIAGDEKIRAKKKSDLFREAFALKEVDFEIAEG